jgi:hypothetical protein
VIARCRIPPSRTWGDSGLFTTCNFGSQSFYSCKETFRNRTGNLSIQACWKSFLLWVCLTDCSAVVAKSRAVNLLYNLLNSACFSIHTVFPVCLQLSVHCAAASIVTVSIYWTFLVGKDIGSVRRNVGRWSRTQGCEEVSYSMTFLQLFLTIPKI